MRNLFWVLFLPMSFLYGFIVYLRRKLYPKSSQYQSKLKVVCVGNIHSGGSGKTPVVREILNQKKSQYVVLSRGYGSKVSKTSDSPLYLNRSSSNGPEEFGDEPWMLSQEFDSPICISKKRVAGILRIEKDYPEATVIMDDGFQHLALKKDLNIICVNTDQKFEDGFCLPLGELREPYSVLNEAQAVVLIPGTKLEQVSIWKSWLDKQFPQVLSFIAKKTLNGIWNKEENCSVENSKKWLGFCGVAQPNRFVSDLASACPNSQFMKAYSDHHVYSHADLQFLHTKVKETGAEGLITTDKDWHKVYERLQDLGARVLRLKISYDLGSEFWNFYDGKLGFSELRGAS